MDYLTDHNGQGSYPDIRDRVLLESDDKEDLNTILDQLCNLGLIYENSALYKLTYPNLKVKYAIPHVTLFYTLKDEPLLRIEDDELFDTFDDILTEQFDIEDYYITKDNRENLAIVTIHFPYDTDKNKLDQAVRSIDQKEVERIYKINNP